MVFFLMEDIISKEGSFDIDLDLEKGGLSSIVTEPIDSELRDSSGLVKVEEGEVLSFFSSCGNGIVSVKSSVVVDKKEVKGKPKVMSAKKPPRPPRGLSLDSADLKFIRELHELAKFRRARIERVKALKKAKETKASSSKNNLFATLFTVLFGLVLLFQGISSRTNSGRNFHDSPIPSGAIESGVISIQQHHFSSMSNIGHKHKSPRRVKRVLGFDTQDKVKSAVD